MIVKMMLVYDKIYFDKIYGEEVFGCYVCEVCLYKMFNYEYDLMCFRLINEWLDICFFVFVDIVVVINYICIIKGNGWLGICFQLMFGGGINDFVLYV